MLAIDILSWPGVDQAFLFSFISVTLVALLVIPFGKRRPVDQRTTWGESMLGATFVFGLLFVAFGIVPHQWIVHADNDLGWRKDKILYGPFDLLKPVPLGGSVNPITISYEAVRDVVVVVIHVFYIGLMIYLFSWWQKRGVKAAAVKEIATSTYGRPLVKKS
jgi:hypothetical protein